MGASGFEQLVSRFGDRTVITYDPRVWIGAPARVGELTAETHAEDYHSVIEAAGLGPVDAFGSSGGGMCALQWVVAHPEDVYALVSHEPPLVTLLEDREMAIKVNADIVETYQRIGFGPTMAKFIQLMRLQGPLPGDYLDRPAPDPAQFGLPTRGRRVTRRPAAQREPGHAPLQDRGDLGDRHELIIDAGHRW